MIYGYIRVSTDRQNTANQRHEIEKFAAFSSLQIDRWVEETVSTRKGLQERRLGRLLGRLQKGDILIATELSRLGRNMLEVMGILQHCLEKDCQIWTLKENYRLGADIQSKVLAFAFSLAGEIERQLISERTRNSLQRLRDEGRRLGRPYGTARCKLQKQHGRIMALLQNNVSKAEIARLMGCTWSTLHRYLKTCLERPKPDTGITRLRFPPLPAIPAAVASGFRLCRPEPFRSGICLPIPFRSDICRPGSCPPEKFPCTTRAFY